MVNMKKMNRLVCILFLALCSATGITTAQEFTASVSSSTVQVGEQFQLTFTLNASGRNFHVPAMPDFNILMGPNQGSQVQIINGAVSQTQSFTYVIQAVKEGTFKIPAADIYVGNNKIVSNTITITVV